MIRLVGAVMLVSGSGMLGLGAVCTMDRRIRDLQGVLMALETMERELSAGGGDLDHILTAAAESTVGGPSRFFLRCRQDLRKLRHGAFSDVWQKALEEGILRLEQQDLTELGGLGRVLGCYDGESQAAALSAAARRLDLRLAQAREQRSGLGKVYGALGISAGLFLVIMLI